MNDVVLRRVGPEDTRFLTAMFLETVCWRDGAPRRSLEGILGDPDLARYIEGWGRQGDAGLVGALLTGERVGAAWYRHFTHADHGYGFVAPDVPELGLGVTPEHRGRGIGRALLVGLISLAKSEGCPALSLSVEEDNERAVRLYEDLAFKRVQRVGGAWTMLLTLDRAS